MDSSNESNDKILSTTGLGAILVQRIFTHDPAWPSDIEGGTWQRGLGITQTDNANHN